MKWRASSSLVAAALVALFSWGGPSVSPATAATLHAADIAATVSDGGCDVQMRLDLETAGAETVDHRLMLFDGMRLTDVQVSNAPGRPATAVGATVSLPVAFDRKDRWRYEVRYRVARAGAGV